MAQVTLKIKSGREYIVPNAGASGKVTLIQKDDGLIFPEGYYKQGTQPPTYEIQDYEWEGPVYETVQKKGGGSLLGLGGSRGLLGSMLGGGAHAAQTRSFEREIKGNAQMTLKHCQTNEVFTILFECDSAINVSIKNMLIKAGIN